MNEKESFAFPSHETGGMTKRELFAVIILAGYAARPADGSTHLAARAYIPDALADADELIADLNKLPEATP